MKTIERQIIKKLEEIIRMYQFPTKIKSYQGIVENTEKYIELSNELASLKSQLKESQCHAIYEKVKEANTPDKRSFEEAEAESQLKDAGQVRSAEDEQNRLRHIIVENIWRYCSGKGGEDAILKYQDADDVASEIIADYFSQFQEQPITDEMISNYFHDHSNNQSDMTRDEVIATVKWALSLETQKVQLGDELEKNGYSFETGV